MNAWRLTSIEDKFRGTLTRCEEVELAELQDADETRVGECLPTNKAETDAPTVRIVPLTRALRLTETG